MDWLPGLIGVVVGGGLAGGFSLWTQRRAASEATAKEARDREHERQVWARQLRYETHARFLLEFGRLHEVAIHHDLARKRGERPDTSDDVASMMWAVESQLTMLELLADDATYEKARAAFHVLTDYATGRGDI
jgi:hypothetical protein